MTGITTGVGLVSVESATAGEAFVDSGKSFIAVLFV